MKKTCMILIALLIIFIVQSMSYAKGDTICTICKVNDMSKEMSGEDGISKEDIIALSKAGARDEVIIMHIKIRCCALLEITDMKELADAGVSEKVKDFIIDYQGKMPGYCEHSDKYRQLQELREDLKMKFKNEDKDNKNSY